MIKDEIISVAQKNIASLFDVGVPTINKHQKI